MLSKISSPASGINRRGTLRLLAGAFGAAALPLARTFAQEKKAPAPTSTAPAITTAPLAGKLSLITGAGGNIALLAGDDGSLVVDSGLADLATGTAAELAKAGPLALLVNTHWHFDHAGGNERLARAGARIIATENCRTRLASEQKVEALGKTFPPSPPSARPLVTFTHETTLHLNDERIRLVPIPPAHTDGDVFVRFETANVLHLGDTFFHGSYPFIDYSSGGWTGGMVAAAKTALTLTDATTKIIPGHGPVATQADLKAYLAFLETVHERLAKVKAAGKSVDEAVAAAPFKDFDAKLGGGFLKPEQFTRFAYESLLRHRSKATLCGFPAAHCCSFDPL
jgi:glyoxylase-like metal-dependent hydrolase (beta-lactamase superfamily II)